MDQCQWGPAHTNSEVCIEAGVRQYVMCSEAGNEIIVDHNLNAVDHNLNAVDMGWRNRHDPNLKSDRVPKELKQAKELLNTNHVMMKTPEIVTLPGQSNQEDSEPEGFTKLKEYIRESSLTESSEVTQPEEDDDDVVICDHEAEDRQDCESAESVQRRVCLVKLYAWIKEEMSKTAAKAVAGYLYQHEQKLLSRGDHESICHCSWRRDAVEQLLKKVLMGPSEINDVFIAALKEHEECHIVDKLVNTHASDKEVNDFITLENASLHQGVRPNHHQPRFTVTPSDHQTLLYFLNNKNTIDTVNDNFLSSFTFSIREHTNICHCALDREVRVRQLLDTMKLCSNDIFEVFCEILTRIEMGHVVRKLEKRKIGDCQGCKQRQKRRAVATQDSVEEPSTSTAAKRQRVDSKVEHTLVRSMQKSSSTLRLHAIEQIGFDVENINKGSIVIQLCPKHPDSWKRLEENCKTGKIKDFIPVVYNNGAIQDMLEEGEYRLQFTIYTLPTPPDKQEVEKKVMFHLETENQKSSSLETDSSCHDNPIEDHMDLLCEELEISKELLALLKTEKLVDGNIKNEIDKQGSRAKKIKYLLKKLSTHGTKGYKVLKDFIKDNNEDLYTDLTTREGVKVIDTQLDKAAKVTPRSKVTGSFNKVSHKKEVFFTGTAVLKVKKNAKAKTKENVNPDSSAMELDISCPEILNPVCHFKSKETVIPGDGGEVTMVFEEAWSTAGSSGGQHREILIGKRKSRDEKSTDDVKPVCKRVHSTEKTDSHDEPESDTDLSKTTKVKVKDNTSDTTETKQKGKKMNDKDNKKPGK